MAPTAVALVVPVTSATVPVIPSTTTSSHTYAAAGNYPTSFAFDAGPFDCTEDITGRGDRPYASSARATHTVVVAAP